MFLTRRLLQTLVYACALAAVGAGSAALAQSATPRQPVAAAPWGVSSSASAFRDHADWFPRMTTAGVSTVRLFPEWRGFEPKRGTWNWEQGDTLLKAAAENKIEINAVLMGSPPGTKAVHAFPMEHLDDWSNYVAAVVGRYHKQVRYWEVWNEGNGGFNDGRHTTTDYARLVATTHTAVKKAAPQAQVGLTVASFDAPYLHQTILALAKAGKPNYFDYLCVHPYELADGLAEVDGEIPFLWMSRLLRDMLHKSAPDRANAEIWITEVGRRIEKKKDHVVTEQEAAQALVKIYTLALAQGMARIQWFEARDPVGEDQGFGLLQRDGTPRPAYKTLQTLTTLLGATPTYQGWLALGTDGKGYGFVFAGKTKPVLIAWMPKGTTDKALTLANDVTITHTGTGKSVTLPAKQPLELTETPLLVVGLPQELVQQAQANASQNFPWGGDYTKAKTVSCQLGTPGGNKGIVPLGVGNSPTVKFADGSTGLLAQGTIGHPVRFYVHPSFANFHTRDYYVRATVRRIAAGNVGMNLLYEVADSQGRTPYANTGKWFGVTAENGWQTYTWHVTDACFSKMWGYDFVLRPEQSLPFAIGKVEVSTEPFK